MIDHYDFHVTNNLNISLFEGVSLDVNLIGFRLLHHMIWFMILQQYSVFTVFHNLHGMIQ